MITNIEYEWAGNLCFSLRNQSIIFVFLSFIALCNIQGTVCGVFIYLTSFDSEFSANST